MQMNFIVKRAALLSVFFKYLDLSWLSEPVIVFIIQVKLSVEEP